MLPYDFLYFTSERLLITTLHYFCYGDNNCGLIILFADLPISSPIDFQHRVSVDPNFNWYIKNPEKSFHMLQKLGEGFVLYICLPKYTYLILCSIRVQVLWSSVQGRAY